VPPLFATLSLLATLGSVAVVGPPALTCPSPGAVERALAGVRPRDGEKWTLLLRPSTEGLHVTLRDPAGATVLSRGLAQDPARCEDAAEAIAIIVDRHFRELAWAPAPRSPAPPPGPSAALIAAPARPPPPAIPSPPRVVVGAGAAYWTRAGSLALALDASALVHGPIGVGAGVLLPPYRLDERLPSGGSARVSGLPLRLRVSAAGSRGRFGGTVGIESLLTFEQGETQDIPTPASGARTLFAAGAGVSGSIALGAGLRLAADLAGYRSLLGGPFRVDGVAGPVLEPPRWQALLGLRLEWTLIP
jgi:hypothetical protein